MGAEVILQHPLLGRGYIGSRDYGEDTNNQAATAGTCLV
jgi:hypothetical protein